MREFNELTNTEKKRVLDYVTNNGSLYYQFKLPLKSKGEYEYYNVRNPLRNDRVPSLSILRNRATNFSYHYDHGSSYHRGDYIKFAAGLHGLRNNEDFPLILDAIAEEIGLDKADPILLKNILETRVTTIEPIQYDFKINILTEFPHTRIEERKTNNNTPTFTLDEIDFENLTDNEKKFLNEKKISIDAMKACNAVFINGYTLIQNNSKSKITKREWQIWIGYKHGECCKIYCTFPKSFRFIGEKKRDLFFGERAIVKNKTGLTQVILTAGEKDCLVLISNGYNAMTLNSETQILKEQDAKRWEKECNYQIIVAYDNDETGIDNAKKLNEKYGFPYIEIPNTSSIRHIKDVDDLFSAYDDAKDRFDGAISKALKNFPEPSSQEIINQVSEIFNKNEIRLSVRTASQRLYDAKFLPDIKPYFGTLFQRGELVFLFGDAGKGKSILAVAIADAISRGKSLMSLPNECEPQIVLYYDFELGDPQFRVRYSNENGEVYPFLPNLYIDNIDISELMTKNPKKKLEEIVLEKAKKDLEETKASVLIIDNITYLSMQTAEDGQVAMILMKLLKQLKNEMNLSILVFSTHYKSTWPWRCNFQRFSRKQTSYKFCR